MLKIIFVFVDGNQIEVEVVEGLIVMENVIKNMVQGIEVECGGVCVCVICYVYVDEVWMGKIGLLELMEEDMFDFVYDVKLIFCLFCQIKVIGELDGLVVYVLECQV